MPHFSAAIISLPAFSQTTQAFAQSAIGFIFGYGLHSLSHAAHASRHALQASAVGGPLRAHNFAAVSHRSRQSALIAALFWCCFMPALTMPSQCALHALQAAMHVLHAFAHRAYITAIGGRFATDTIADVPDTMNVLWEYPDKTATFTMMQSNSFHFGVGRPHKGRHNGIIFHGMHATLTIVNYGTPEVLDRDGKVVEGVEYPQSVAPSPGQLREFIDGVKSRVDCSCSFASQLPMHTAMNLAHLSLQLGRQLRWDEAKWEVIGDPEAQRLITPEYRPPWKLPA